MAAQKLTPQQQRDRRAKLMLAVLGVVLLAVLGFQLPKLMKGGGGSSSAASADTTGAAAALAQAPVAQLAAAAAAPGSGQLLRFSRFAAKNPFDAKVKLPTGPEGGSTAGGTTDTTASTKTGAQAGGGGSSGKSKTTTTAPTVTLSMTQQPAAPAKPAGPVVPQVPAALLLVNGKKHVLTLDGGFPARRPLFRVVALSKKAVWIQLIGGSLQNGSTTIKLVRGRKVTLVNTTAGIRYVLTLVKPTTAPAPPPKPKAAAPAPAPASTTTSPTQTSPTTTLPTSTTAG